MFVSIAAFGVVSGREFKTAEEFQETVRDGFRICPCHPRHLCAHEIELLEYANREGRGIDEVKCVYALQRDPPCEPGFVPCLEPGVSLPFTTTTATTSLTATTTPLTTTITATPTKKKVITTTTTTTTSASTTTTSTTTTIKPTTKQITDPPVTTTTTTSPVTAPSFVETTTTTAPNTQPIAIGVADNTQPSVNDTPATTKNTIIPMAIGIGIGLVALIVAAVVGIPKIRRLRRAETKTLVYDNALYDNPKGPSLPTEERQYEQPVSTYQREVTIDPIDYSVTPTNAQVATMPSDGEEETEFTGFDDIPLHETPVVVLQQMYDHADPEVYTGDGVATIQPSESMYDKAENILTEPIYDTAE